MRLSIAHPLLPACSNCEKYDYDMDTGRLIMWRGQPSERHGASPPCGNCPKCPLGEVANPETGKRSEMSPKNLATLRLYWKAKAGCLPREVLEDDIVAENFAAIQEELFYMQPAMAARPLGNMIAPLLARR